MGLSHADAAVQKERIVGFRGPLGDGLASRMGELIRAADDESIEGIARIQLGRAIPVKARLGWMRYPGCRTRGKAAIMTHGRGCRIIFRSNEFDVLIFEPEIVEGFL